MGAGENRDSDLASALKAALRSATPIALDPELVLTLAGSGRARAFEAEKVFKRAFVHGLSSVPVNDRPAGLNGVTGHIAESLIETMFVENGWHPLEHFEGPFSGGHGIDLAFASPDLASAVAVEVKGTLASRRWPTLRGGDVPQLSETWMSKPGNPGVASLGLEPELIPVVVAVVQFGRRLVKSAWSVDLTHARPLAGFDYADW